MYSLSSTGDWSARLPPLGDTFWPFQGKGNFPYMRRAFSSAGYIPRCLNACDGDASLSFLPSIDSMQSVTSNMEDSSLRPVDQSGQAREPGISCSDNSADALSSDSVTARSHFAHADTDSEPEGSTENSTVRTGRDSGAGDLHDAHPLVHPCTFQAMVAFGPLPTAGSLAHDFGTCKPCTLVHKSRCVQGFACPFCHLCPKEAKAERKRFRMLQG